MKLSIIVPAYNEEKLIGRSLEHIRKAGGVFQAAGWSVDIIVCDNHSTDRTAVVAREHGAQVVYEPVNQIARARNRGASIARGDWFLFIDADSFPSPELFEDLRGVIEGGKVLGGGSVVALDRPVGWGKGFVVFWNFLSRWNRWMAGSFVFCQAAVFRELGGFSEEWFVSEEIDFSKRLKRLARQRGRRVIILRRHPLVTSSRKLHLYSAREYRAFVWHTLSRRGRNMKAREACPIWYDGRR